MQIFWEYLKIGSSYWLELCMNIKCLKLFGIKPSDLVFAKGKNYGTIQGDKIHQFLIIIDKKHKP